MSKKSIKILLIDDDPATIHLHEWIAKKMDTPSEIYTASNGLAAINFLETITSDSQMESFLIIFDVNMPVMNGWEFLSAYSNLTVRQGLDFLVLMSSNMREDKEKILENNFDFVNICLQKPLKKADFRAILSQYQQDIMP